jgi:hypothetical protein
MVGRPSTPVFLALLALVVVPSCSRRTTLATDPAASSSLARGASDPTRSQPNREPGDFYPLVTGNRWAYVSNTYSEARTLDGTLVSSGTQIDDIHRSIECETSAYGESWLVQLDRYRTRGQSSDRLDWVRLRQDREGLYELEVVPTDPYPCGPLAGVTMTPGAGVAANSRMVGGIADRRFRAAVERALRAKADLLGRLSSSSDLGATTLVRLKYPLHPGASWSIRPESNGNPLFLATVEAQEVLALPAGRFPGYRIRITSSLFGPDDSVLIWFGRAGWLGMDAHVVYSITDDQGTVLGRGFSDQHVRLTSIGQPGLRAANIEERK